MGVLDERQLQTQVPVAGWLPIVSNAILRLIGPYVLWVPLQERAADYCGRCCRS